MMTIAAAPKHLGARIGITAVLHTWGSAMMHHPHVHMIMPGGGISLDGQRWVSSRPAFLLPVRVLGALFRRLFLSRLTDLTLGYDRHPAVHHLSGCFESGSLTPVIGLQSPHEQIGSPPVGLSGAALHLVDVAEQCGCQHLLRRACGINAAIGKHHHVISPIGGQ